MARYSYDRLSSQDHRFFAYETANTPMHVSSVLLFEAGSLATPDGGIDFERIKRGFGRILHLMPPYRRRIEWTPLERHPVWVDDEHFNLDYHVRHASLPRPGTEEQLKRLAGRVTAQPLDPSRPLWEHWVVEGLEGGRFAVVTKTHHCMVDGSSGADLVQAILSTDPRFDPPEPPRFVPRTPPSRGELLSSAVRHQLGQPFRAVAGIRDLRRESEDFAAEVGQRLRALASVAGATARPAQETPINGEVGPHRIFDWRVMTLSDFKVLRGALECTVNDVVLTTLCGAVRDYLQVRHVRPEAIRFRVSAPVSIRTEEDGGRFGNRVSSWVLEFPIGEPDPLRQLEKIRATTRGLKESRQALGVQMMAALGEITPGLIALATRVTAGPQNTLVTNVPGPQFPLYLLGAKLEQMFIAAPLLPNQGLATALMSYNGQVCWGFNADPGLLPDLDGFAGLVERSFRRLADAAGVRLGGPTLVEPPAEAPQERRSGSRGARRPPTSG